MFFSSRHSSGRFSRTGPVTLENSFCPPLLRSFCDNFGMLPLQLRAGAEAVQDRLRANRLTATSILTPFIRVGCVTFWELLLRRFAGVEALQDGSRKCSAWFTHFCYTPVSVSVLMAPTRQRMGCEVKPWVGCPTCRPWSSVLLSDGCMKEECSFEARIRGGRFRCVGVPLKRDRALHDLAHQCTMACRPHSYSQLLHEEITHALESWRSRDKN